jgi:hypothetical protein
VPIIRPEETESEDARKYNAELQRQNETFAQALANLNLPSKVTDVPRRPSNSLSSAASRRKAALSTNFQAGNPFHMIELIDLSNFVHRVIKQYELV